MIINDLLEKEKMSRYRLSKESGVAMTTITDICSGKADLDKCTAGTLHKIAKVLNVTVDSILENNSADNIDYRCSFETFKSNVKHLVKENPLNFIEYVHMNQLINQYVNLSYFPEALYLLAMIDYLSRIYEKPIVNAYNNLREYKLNDRLYPASIVVMSQINPDSNILNESYESSIEEFKRFNIVESEIENIV